MKNKFWIIVLIIAILIGGILSALEKTTESDNKPTFISVPTTEQVTNIEVTLVTEASVVENFNVTEVELQEIEHCMRISGWNYSRADFERVYRLKDEEMILNPAIFAEYEVTIKDGTTQTVTINKSLIGE